MESRPLREVIGMTKKTADSMFKELGFVKEANSEYSGVYSNYNGTIIFDKHYNYIIIMNDKKLAPVIGIKLHQAIHQKLIELGWIE